MKITDVIKVINTMGLSWVIFRTSYELKRKTGILKRKFAVKAFSDEDFIDKISINNLKSKEDLYLYIKENRNKFLFNTQDLNSFKQYLDVHLSKEDKEKIIQIADKAIKGQIYCFNHWTGDYGCPINWHKNPINKYEWPKDKHWVDIEVLSKTSGDVKYVWEASRFTQVFYFVRAYTITRDEKYAQAYWEQIEHWLKENRYELGVNWQCGQEISFRTFAWIFGLYAFLDSVHTTADRVFRLIKNIYFNAIHIEKNINLAIKSAQNSHAISEAAGLFTVGVLFPFFRDSERLLSKGKKYLEQEGFKQIYEDGSYMQSSNNYHRLMLQDYTWVYRIAELNGVKFCQSLLARLKKALAFLYQMQDEITGMVPNYGNNDGALVFPLSSCDYLNYKPQLNTLSYIINGKKLYEKGKHEEDLLWFCGVEAVQSSAVLSVVRETKRFASGGYYIIRGSNSWGMVRCTKYKDRPAQADMLHFDLWYKGKNVLTDIGSYSYNPEEKFRDYFRATRNHNTITINDKNQAEKGPRFLFLDWSEGVLTEFNFDKEQVFFSGYHNAYKNTHTRKIEYKKNYYIITDEIDNKKRKNINIKLNWNIGTEIEKLDNNKYRLIIDNEEDLILEISSTTQGDTYIYFGDEEKPIGWRSLYYGEKIPVNQLVYEVNSREEKEVLVTKIIL
ncbi:MAG: alginate lyase family protein [Peptococcia bacterium]